MKNPCFRTIMSGRAICLRIGYIFGALCLWDVFGMISEWYRNGIGMPSGSFRLPKFQGIVCLNFIFYFVEWKVEIRQMCYMILLVFFCR